MYVTLSRTHDVHKKVKNFRGKSCNYKEKLRQS